MISTVQIVATWVSNLFSKFQLNRTIDEVITAHWWNLGSEMRFFSLFLLFSLFFFPIPFFFFQCNWLGPQAYGAHSFTYEETQQISFSRLCEELYQACLLSTKLYFLCRYWCCHHIWSILINMDFLKTKQFHI